MKAGQLVTLREKLGLSVPQFAALLGVNHTSIYHWESGRHRITNKAVRERLTDLWQQHFGPPWGRGDACFEVAKRLGMDLDRAGLLLVEYGRNPGEPWEDVVRRVVDGERFLLGRSAATG